MARRTLEDAKKLIQSRDESYRAPFDPVEAAAAPASPASPSPVPPAAAPPPAMPAVELETRKAKAKAASVVAPVPPVSRRRGGDGARPREGVVVQIRPLARQADRIAATGLPAHEVRRAAWLKAKAGLAISPTFVERRPEPQATGEAAFPVWVTVDTDVLASLALVADRLGVRGKSYLIRGQIEPAFWQALDEVLDSLDKA